MRMSSRVEKLFRFDCLNSNEYGGMHVNIYWNVLRYTRVNALICFYFNEKESYILSAGILIRCRICLLICGSIMSLFHCFAKSVFLDRVACSNVFSVIIHCFAKFGFVYDFLACSYALSVIFHWCAKSGFV